MIDVHRAAADTSVFHAIADPTRRAILDLLREGERPAGALLDGIATTQSALSQHLAVLRRAGLVTFKKLGRLRVYALRPEPLSEVADWVAYYEKFWSERLASLREYLDRHEAANRIGGAGEQGGKTGR